MQKVNFFRSIQVKVVLIYILLILIALQIIGLYFSKELEESLKTNFQESISQRMELVQYSIREELMKDRDESSPSIQESLGAILREFSTDDTIEIRVLDSRSRVLATSESDQQGLVGQKANEESGLTLRQLTQYPVSGDYPNTQPFQHARKNWPI